MPPSAVVPPVVARTEGVEQTISRETPCDPPARGARAWVITLIYAGAATFWMMYSDRLWHWLVPGMDGRPPEKLVRSALFVVPTALLLWGMLRRGYDRLEEGYWSLREQESEVARLSRLYAALSQINQAIVWSKDREALFRRICEVLTSHGGFRMAWIGWHDPEGARLVPVAQAGDDQGYLQSIRMYTDDRPEGRGPAGQAYREGGTCLCNDMLLHADDLEWRQKAAAHGFRASAAIPIRMQNEVCAVLSVYASQQGFFKDREVALLEEAAVDISFALENLAREEARRKAQAQVDEEKHFSDTMIESMPGVLYFYDDTGRFLRWNRNFESVTGYSGAEIAKMIPLQFFEASDQAPLAERIAEVFEHGESSIESPLRSRDGSTTPYFFTGRRILFRGRSCLVGVGIDLSARREAELALQKSEERHRTTLDTILESCQILDFDWKYLYLNAAAAVQNRRPNAEVLGKRMPEVWPGFEATPLFERIRECLEQRVAFQEEVDFVFPDGHRSWFDLRCEPVPEGVCLLSVDVTDRHHATAALQELNRDLERKVGERTSELQAALVRAEAADRLKSAFLATMSHELRTPLNSIIGFTGIVLQELAGPLNPEQSKQLGMVRNSARHLLELINDVLDLSRIEAGQLEVREAPFPAAEAIQGVVELVRPLAEKKGIRMELEVDPSLPETLIQDRRRLEQILLNLLNNAIKFTEMGTVKLGVKVLPNGAEAETETEAKKEAQPGPAGGWLECVITDTGIGILETDLATLFQPFRQIDSGLSRQHEGTGLGLAICRRLASLLGGTITAQSQYGRGSIFTVCLPLNLSGSALKS